ncbi:MAG: FAD binding domain-containing protein [Planctomycetota bacterium]|nr:FAD binding domain-containing protein [Planctomycetota bacterium]
MNPFEYASPETEVEALELLNDHDGNTAVLAGGIDQLNLMQLDLSAPQRIVDIKNIDSMRGTQPVGDGVLVGALSTLEELKDDPLLADYRSLGDAVEEVRAIQLQHTGTLGGDLCHMPNCWYYRNGYGLLARENNESLVETGDNRYHAILGNQGPAKFVNASRFAPALIAWGARVRIIGPAPGQEELLPLEYFYVTPRHERQGNNVLQPGQMISHIWLPSPNGMQSATYDVMQLEGLDWPLASAACALNIENGIVRDAKIVMGHVAPVPWIARDASQRLIGQPINEATAQLAADEAVLNATPLTDNGYKVQIAKTAVKRALLKAADQLEL